MIIYVFALLTIFLLLNASNRKRIKKKNAFISIAVLLILIVGLRNISMGQFDTEVVYQSYFIKILNNDLAYVFTLKDTGFQLLTYIFTKVFGNNFKLYVFLFSIPYISAITFLIYKYSANPLLSYVFFICLQYFEISFTLIRQVNAMAFLIFSTYFLIEKKYMKMLILVLLASLFHLTSIVYLLILPISKVKIRKIYLLVIILISLVFLAVPTNIIDFIYKVIGSDSRFYIYSIKGQQKTYIFFILNLLIWIVCLLGYNFSKSTREQNIFFACSTIAVFLSPLSMALGEISRLVYYFGLYEIIIFPNICLKLDRKSKMIFVSACSICFITYFIFILGPGSNVIPYIPFWKI